MTQDDDAAISHYSAATLLDHPWTPTAWSAETSDIHVTVARDDDHRHRPHLRRHEALLTESDVVLVNGIRCTTPARTVVDLARDRGMSHHRLLAVQLIDGARRFQRCTRDDLNRVLFAAAGLRNVRRAREWVALGRDGVDSPQETRMRLLLWDAGFTDIEPDVRIYDDEGLTLLARGDLCDRSRLLWGEYDGYATHIKQPVFRSDRVGDRWLNGRGWDVVRVVDSDLADPRAFLRDWERKSSDAAGRIAALDPCRSPELAAAWHALGLGRSNPGPLPAAHGSPRPTFAGY